MTDDKTPPEGDHAATPPSNRPTNRPTTIDLKASEFKADTAPASDVPPASEATADGTPHAEATTERDTTTGEGHAGSRRTGPGLATFAIAAAASVLFFVVGFAAAQWFGDRLFAPRQTATPVQAAAPVQPAIDPQFQARLSKLEAAMAAAPQSDPQLLARITAAEAAVKSATELAAQRERRSDEIAKTANDAREQAAKAAAAAEAAQKSNPDVAQSRGEVEELAGRVAALEQKAQALEQSAQSNESELQRRANTPTDDSAGRRAIVSRALRNSVESGAPFTAELAAAKAMFANAPAINTLQPFASSGVPTAPALARELSAQMPAIWKALGKTQTNEGSFLQRLQANAERIVRVRPAGESTGDDPNNVAARIETRAQSGDIQGALDELSKLPPDAQAPAQSWVAKAKARQAAIAAAREIDQTALNALTKSGS